ncbi:MAG: ATP-binding cassette domain-containing protein [Clostridiales bacterium]|nr:ATP-binding cassette domain-containing protein [Clostridiales bacterium]
MSLLTIQNVKKEYRNQTVLNGASLQVSKGERLALIGPNGSGKTTLLRIAMGLEEPDSGNVIRARQSSIGYLSQDLNELLQGDSSVRTAMDYDKVILMEKMLRETEAQMTLAVQHKDAEYERIFKKYSELVEAYEAMDGYTIESKIKAILLGLGLREEALLLPVEKLSGGERMRVVLSRLLLEEPDLLILDEPTNHLDIRAIEWLEDFLKRFSGGVLLVSHDRYFLDSVANRTAELSSGTVTEISGNYSTFMEQKQRKQEYIQQEKRRLRHQMKEANQLTQKLMSMAKSKAAKSRMKTTQRLNEELSATIAKTVEREHLKRHDGPKLKFAHASHISAEIAKAENLHKRFGNVILFSGADFLIKGGERVGIIGPNGCGKTTLIRILLGWDTDFEGTACLGSWVRYGYIGQELSFADESRTIMEEIMAEKEMLISEAHRHLARFQFYGDETNKQICVLSGGERMRLTLAKLMLEEPHCLVLDEPTNHLDVSAREALEKAILDFRGSVIAISHDRYFLTRCVNRIMEIHNGKISMYEGNYQTYRQEKQTEQTQSINLQKQKVEAVKKKESMISSSTNADLASLENAIIELEEEVRVLEESFNEETPYLKYEEYRKLQEQIDELYASWNSIQ